MTANETTMRPVDAPARERKARDTGILRMKFDMSDCWIHLWLGTAEQWEAGPGSEPPPEGGAWPDWAALHPDLDTSRVVAVRCELKPEHTEKYERVEGWCSPNAEAVAQMRKLRGLILDALEASDDVRRVDVIAGGDGRAEFDVGIVSDTLTARQSIGGPWTFARLVFFDDEDERW